MKKSVKSPSTKELELKIRKIERLYEAVQYYRTLSEVVRNHSVGQDLEEELDYIRFVINYAV